MLERLVRAVKLWIVIRQLDSMIRKRPEGRIMRNERLIPLLLSYPDRRIRSRGRSLLACHRAAVRRVTMDLATVLPLEIVHCIVGYLA